LKYILKVIDPTLFMATEHVFRWHRSTET